MDNLKELLKSESGVSLRKFLTDSILQLRDIDNLKELSSATEMTIEVKSQKKAFSKLVDILEEIGIITADYHTEKKEEDNLYAI